MSDPKGILRNKNEAESPSVVGDKLDRQEVIKNTRLNAQLTNESKSNGDAIRAKIAEAKAKDGKSEYPDHIAWDELNLYKAEQERSATMKIDEPKTPYEKGFDPTGEYYQEDEEEIPDFNLGQAAAGESEHSQSLGGSEIIKDDQSEEEESEEESQPLTKEERHKKFEELRKAHYHMKGSVLGKKIDVSDDEE